MTKGANLALLPGGFEEATLYQNNCYRVYVRKRTGFIVYALRYGYNIYPSFVFGEEKCYLSLMPDWGWLTKARLCLNRYRFPAVGFVGKLLLVPGWDSHLVTVIGSPVVLPRLEKPTEEEVKKYHLMYVSALIELFDKHKGQYCEKGAKLEVW